MTLVSTREAKSGGVRSLEACAILTIDLAALAENWRFLNERCGATECGAVVKADAYGIGLEPAVKTLRAAGCKTFFVAQISEGRKARALAPDATIYVLSGLLPGTAPAYAEHKLRPVLGSLAEIEEWSQFCALFGGLTMERDAALAAALHLDTGMSRLGLAAADLNAAASLTRSLNITLVLSHLAWSGRAKRANNGKQIDLFKERRRHWADRPASIANSTGLFLDKAPLYDLARPGYALYGGNPTPHRKNPMRPVVQLEARIIQIQDVAAGTTVGYNGLWTAPTPRRLATIGVGYADGIACGARGTDQEPGGQALVKGTLCSFVGRISMDLISIDVTEAPTVDRGDLVELLGATIGIDDLAARAGTIGYEILTHLGSRFHRRYKSA